MSAWHGGKGSGRRDSANDKKFAEGWDRIFGSKKKDPQSETTQHTGGVRRREKKDITK